MADSPDDKDALSKMRALNIELDAARASQQRVATELRRLQRRMKRTRKARKKLTHR